MTRRHAAIGLVCLLAAGVPTGCGDEDPVGPPPERDGTPPLVVATVPMDGVGGVDPGEPLEIHFSEAMAPGSAAGNVTLAGGALTTSSWRDDRVLVVDHESFAAEAEITLTVGTGLADRAGNRLAAPYVARFLAESPNLVVMAVAPAGDAGDVPVNTGVAVRFSESVDPAEIAAGVTVWTDDGAGKARIEHAFTVRDRRFGSYVLIPDADLPAASPVHVEIPDTLRSQQGKTPAAPYAHVFTTGDARDTTPPSIIAIDPPDGATDVAPDQGYVRLTFSEPIARMTAPTARNLAYDMIELGYFGRQVWQWNADFTELTLGLPSGLPAGLTLAVTFGALQDANGVEQTGEHPWRVRVAGDPELFPLADGDRYVDSFTWQSGVLGDDEPTGGGRGWAKIRIDGQPDGTFRAAGYFNPNPEGDPFLVPTGAWDGFEWTPAAVRWLGWRSEDDTAEGGHDVDPPLTVLPLPTVAGTWTQSALASAPDGTATSLDLAGTVLPRSDLPLRGNVFVADAAVVVLEFAERRGGELVATRRDSVLHAPGLGPLRTLSYAEDLPAGSWRREETWRWPYSETTLHGGSGRSAPPPALR